MKIIKTNNKKIIATILFFICSLFFISGIWIQNTRAFAAITGQYNYTDSDYLTDKKGVFPWKGFSRKKGFLLQRVCPVSPQKPDNYIREV